MNIQKKVLLLMLGSISSCLSLSAICATDDSLETNVINFGDENTRRIIAENTINGRLDSSQIPSNVYYQIIFRDLLVSPQDFLTDRDLTLLTNLPSHNDKQFLTEMNSVVGSVCSGFDENTPQDRIADKAAKFDEITSNYENLLDRHYEKFITTLSQQAQFYVRSEFRELATGNQVGYSRLKFAGIAAESSPVAQFLLLTGCETYRSRSNEFVNKSIKLSDEEGIVVRIK